MQSKSELQTPTIQCAYIAGRVIADLQFPRAIRVSDRRCVYGKGSYEVVRAAAGAVPQCRGGAIRRDQFHRKIAYIGMSDVHGYL